MSMSDPIRDAITHHRQAWDTFQVAPGDAECGDPRDPFLVVLDRANAAEEAHTLAAESLDETDEGAMRACNAACDRAAAARRDLVGTLPGTLGALRALACHYVRWGESSAEEGFLHLARALVESDPDIPLKRSGGRQ